MQARALLDSMASMSLISEQLAQRLQLQRRRSNSTINGVEGIHVHPRHIVNFKVGGSRSRQKPPSFPPTYLPLVSPVTKWKHLSGLEFRDPDYKTPLGGVDILLGGKVFCKAVFPGQQHGPTQVLSAFKVCFGWVLNGEVKGIKVDVLQQISAGLPFALMH